MQIKAIASSLLVAVLGFGAAQAEVLFEAKGMITDKTPGFRFGNIVFTDADRTRAKFESVPMTEGASGRLTTNRIKLPKEEGKSLYFKFSFNANYTFTPGKPSDKQVRCNQGVFFYDKTGKVLPDCYDTLYPTGWHHYDRVLYAWDEVDSIEVFFQKPWEMREANGDKCELQVSDLRIETATVQDALNYIGSTYSKLPSVKFHPEGDALKDLPRTKEALKTGKPWRIVLLGDSIMQDTFNSQFHALVKEAYPKSNVEWILSMRGGTGCWHYILAENFYSYVVDKKPDLLIIGGISNFAPVTRKDVGPTGADAMVRVAKVARERLGCEVLIVNNALAVDVRPKGEHEMPDSVLPKTTFGPEQYGLVQDMKEGYGELKDLCAANNIPWWDLFTPCYSWLFGSGLPRGFYSRDYVHSSELGKQIIGHVMLAYFLTGK